MVLVQNDFVVLVELSRVTDETVYLKVRIGKKIGEQHNQMRVQPLSLTTCDNRILTCWGRAVFSFFRIRILSRNRAARSPHRWYRTCAGQPKNLRERTRVGCRASGHVRRIRNQTHGAKSKRITYELQARLTPESTHVNFHTGGPGPAWTIRLTSLAAWSETVCARY